MSKICFTSVCTDDTYQFFIPLFVYSTHKAYPDAGVRIFLKGELKNATKEALRKIPKGDWKIKEKCFSRYPDSYSITNSLRFLVSRKDFVGYNYIFVRDIDFLIFRHKVSHEAYFSRRMKNLPYSGVRGPYIHPRRYQINRRGWKGNFTRVAGGTFAFKNPDWYDKTEKMLRHYRHNLKRGIPDRDDNNKPCSYREYDEVMLYRIIKGSGLLTPRRKGKDAYGKSMAKIYRDIHLGDFNKDKHGYRRLAQRVSVECLRQFVELEKDETWREIRKIVSLKSGTIREVMRRLGKHVKRRLNLSYLSGEEIVKKQL